MTRDEPATSGSDVAPLFGVIAFQDGETEQLLLIPIVDDADVQSTENLQVILRYAEEAPRSRSGVDECGGG